MHYVKMLEILKIMKPVVWGMIGIIFLILVIKKIQKVKKLDSIKKFRDYKKRLGIEAIINVGMIIITLGISIFFVLSGANLINIGDSIPSIIIKSLVTYIVTGLHDACFVMVLVHLGLYVYVEAKLRK